MNLLVVLTLLGVLNINAVFSRRRYNMRSPSHRAAHGETCLSGNGSGYRGFVSESIGGRKCLSWYSFENTWGSSKGIGDHNYCRNPDQSLMPWCPVQRGRRIVKRYCHIPKCSPSTVKPPSSVDTELTCGETSENKLYKIVGGSFTPIESHPWVTSIFAKRSGFLCGGSLIAPCWVLSAAHCFSDGEETNIKQLSVYLGKSATNETDDVREQKFTVEKLVIHPKFNESNYNNDIALLKISSKDGSCAVQSASARTVCLPPAYTQLPTGFQCSIAGYGMERFGAWHFSRILKQGEVRLISQTECRSKPDYANLVTDNMFCAGSPDWRTDACKGDSGGPLVCEASGRMFLFGVVSWGVGCAQKNNPGVYTQVSNYNQWIAKITRLPKYTKGVMYPTK